VKLPVTARTCQWLTTAKTREISNHASGELAPYDYFFEH